MFFHFRSRVVPWKMRFVFGEGAIPVWCSLDWFGVNAEETRGLFPFWKCTFWPFCFSKFTFFLDFLFFQIHFFGLLLFFCFSKFTFLAFLFFFFFNFLGNALFSKFLLVSRRCREPRTSI